MATRRHEVILVLVALLVVAIWFVVEQRQGDDTRDTSIAPHQPACQLLSPEEIQQALGQPVGAGQAVTGADACFWQVGSTVYDPDRGEFVGARLDFVDLTSWFDYSVEVGQPGGGETVRRIRIGSVASLLESAGNQRRVLARSGRHVLQLYASTTPSGTWRVTETVALMRLALARLDDR